MTRLIRSLNVCLMMALLAFVSGCAFTSYSFKGKHSAAGSTVPAGPFVLESFTCKTDADHNDSIDADWCISSAGSRMKKAAIEKALLECYPSLFSTSSNGCPVSVSMRVLSSKEDIYWGMLLFLCSVGTLPLWSAYDDDCEVRVRIGTGDHEIVCPVEKVGYKSCVWMTLYTPIGLFQPKSREGHNGECRFGAAWVPDHSGFGNKDKCDVFCIEAAHAVVAALSRCDSDDLKRSVLYESLRAVGDQK